jgi:proteasome lid subunit RPN8/RPN11
MILRLKSQDVNLLKEISDKVFPIEACAILFGHMSQDESYVNKIIVTSNILQSTVRFEINPEIIFKALHEAEIEGLDLIGFFHSHQTQAKPSSIDQKYMKLWGNAIWLIYSINNDNMAAFQLLNEKVLEVSIITED